MRLISTAIVFLFSISPLAAQDCPERFAELLKGQLHKGGVKIHVTQTIVGGMTSTNWHYNTGDGHWMTEMIEPENMAWSLMHDNKFYTSSDRGKTWTFVRAMDDAGNNENAKKQAEMNAETATNQQCGQEEVDGKMLETVSGTYISSAMQGAEIDQKYWVEPDSGWIARSTMHVKGNGFEMKTDQLLEPAQQLSLPVPQ